MPFTAIGGEEETELVMKYILSQQPVELAVLSSLSVCLTFQHLFLTRLSANGRERIEPIGVGQVTWWWWDSSARQSYITRPYIGIFHSSGRCRAEPGLFLVQGPCQVFGISASRERPGLTTTSTTTWGREKI